MINTVTITGNLGGRPEGKTLESGLEVSKFSVALNEVRGKGDEKKEYTHWIECAALGNLAAVINKYLDKGSRVTLVGRLQQQRWLTSDGKKMSKLIVFVENIAFMSKPRNEFEPDVPWEESGISENSAAA